MVVVAAAEEAVGEETRSEEEVEEEVEEAAGEETRFEAVGEEEGAATPGAADAAGEGGAEEGASAGRKRMLASATSRASTSESFVGFRKPHLHLLEGRWEKI